LKTGELRSRVEFQILDEGTEEWSEHFKCSAKINIAGGKEYFGSGSEQSVNNTIFTVRYCSELKDVYLNTQLYRIKFRNAIYDIQEVDNYMFKNESLKIKAVGR